VCTSAPDRGTWCWWLEGRVLPGVIVKRVCLSNLRSDRLCPHHFGNGDNGCAAVQKVELASTHSSCNATQTPHQPVRWLHSAQSRDIHTFAVLHRVLHNAQDKSHMPTSCNMLQHNCVARFPNSFFPCAQSLFITADLPWHVHGPLESQIHRYWQKPAENP
jgi:hypothetical protein